MDVAEFGRHERKSDAMWFFNRLQQNFSNGFHQDIENGSEDSAHSLEGQFGVLLKFCSTAAEMMDMVNDPPSGVVVSEGHINALINRLVLEGDDTKAMALAESFSERGQQRTSEQPNRFFNMKKTCR